MLLNLYHQLLIMSIVAGGLYLILKLFSPVTLRYFTTAWHYYSYIFLSTFFLIPYYSVLPRSGLHFIPRIDELGFRSQTALNSSAPVDSATGKIAALSGQSYAVHSHLELLPYFLMAGTLIFIIIFFVQNYKLNRRIFGVCRLTDDKQVLQILSKCRQEMGISQEIPVYISTCTGTPFLTGIFRPRLVLPDIKFDSEELYYIIFHELTHWRNHDAWLKSLMLFVNVVHWFNPLVYIARRDIDRFCELFCDESVASSMNNEERRRYCSLILSVLWHVADQKNKLCSAFSDKRNIERRVEMIMKNEGTKSKKIRIFAIVMTLVFALTGTLAAYAATEDGYKVKTSATFAAGEKNDLLSSAENNRSLIEDGYKTKTSPTSGGSLRLSFGEGNLHTNSITGNAWASTETYSGNADYLYVYVGVGNNMTIYDSDYDDDYDEDYIETDTVHESYSGSRFARSNHTITYNGETQTATITDNY